MKAPTAFERRRWSAIIDMGCAITLIGISHACGPRRTIHHCFTGAGGRKVHADTICLCWNMHLGDEGIDGGRMAKSQWQRKYAQERHLLDMTDTRLWCAKFPVPRSRLLEMGVITDAPQTPMPAL